MIKRIYRPTKSYQISDEHIKDIYFVDVIKIKEIDVDFYEFEIWIGTTQDELKAYYMNIQASSHKEAMEIYYSIHVEGKRLIWNHLKGFDRYILNLSEDDCTKWNEED